MGGQYTDSVQTAKKKRQLDREYNTPLFLLRCVSLGIPIRDLDLLSVGMVTDMFIEQANDGEHYDELATSEDIDLL